MKQLIPIKQYVLEGEERPGTMARDLYAFLGLAPAAYSRWTIKNIVKNAYALEHIDWEGFQHHVENPIYSPEGGRPTQEYVLSIPFAKKLAMMARSAKGEEAREYFLACERAAQAQPTLPVLHNPVTQIAIETLLRVDALEHELNEQKKEHAVLAASLATADAKADLALEDAHTMTLENYITKNGLLRQFPRGQWTRYAKWLANFCLAMGLHVHKVSVYGKAWGEENAYPLAALHAWERQEIYQPRQVHLLRPDDAGGNAHA